MELNIKKDDLEKGPIILNRSTSHSFSRKETDQNEISDLISLIQPSLHENKKSCFEYFCKNILMPNYDLTQNEYSKLNILRKDCIINYEEKNEKHEKLLADFLDTYIELCKENKKEMKNKAGILWKEIGFQGENPRTDFRAGGLYSLKFMHYFAWKYSDDLADSVNLDYFMFAVVSIRLTFIFKLFLNLVKDDELESSLKSHKIYSCSRKQFKNFCSFLNYNPDILLVVLSKGLIYVKNKFKEELDLTKNELNFLLIDPLIKKALRYLEHILNQTIKPENIENYIVDIYDNDVLNYLK